MQALQTNGQLPNSDAIIIPDPDNNFECLVCEMQIWSNRQLHEKSARHQRLGRHLLIRSALEEAEKDKNGVSITPAGKDAFDMGLSPDGRGKLGFALSVGSPSLRIYLHSATITSVGRGGQSWFSVNISTKLYLNPATVLEGTVLFDSNGNRGRFQDRLELIFQDVTAQKKFAIVKTLTTIVGDAADYELLKPIAPYVPKVRRQREVIKELVEGEPPIAISHTKWAVKLHEYEPPKALKTILDMPDRDGKLKLLRAGFIPRSFVAQTHSRLFHILLYIEEHQSAIDLERYDQENVLLKPPGSKGGVLYSLEVPGLAEKRPSVILGDRILVKPHASTKPKWWQGYVHRVGLTEVGLRFNKDFSAFKGQRVDVRFCLNRSVLRRMHQALDSGGLCERLLFPTSKNVLNPKPSSGTLKALNPINRVVGNNPPQRLAVSAIKNLRPGSPPFVIFGPPGTGKTITVVEAIRQILLMDRNSRILACAPSNSAADIIAERLRDIGKSELFRLNAYSRPIEHLPKSLLGFSLEEGGAFRVPDINVLEKYRVIVSTCASASVPFGMGIKPGHFTHIFIDEAGQACEPEALVPIKNLSDSKTNVVLSGDPKQLGPIIRSDIAVKLNFGVSLLDRLHEMPIYDETSQNGVTIVKLTRNFRSHEAILKFPNEKFYRGELTCEADKALTHSLLRWERLPKPGFPVIFHALTGKDLREARSPSFFNIEEASQVKSYVQSLLGDKLGLVNENIGIIAPYHAQCGKIRMLINQFAKGIKVGSVEEFQGQERRVIIISTVRSNLNFVQSDVRHTLGFVANPRRFNVAVTRAQALLIIVGDPMVLSLDPLWRSFLSYIYNNGGWIGTPKPDWDTNAEINGQELLNLRKGRATVEEDELLQRIAETVEHRMNIEGLEDLGDGYEAVERPWRETE